jgi:hypothetical protein
MSESSANEAPRRCALPGCGRQLRARGLCVTHYEQMRTTGTATAIRPMRTPRKDTVKVCSRSVSRECAAQLRRYARERGWSLNRTMTEVLERWHRRRRSTRGAVHPRRSGR